jgi:hypothetical protein
MNSQTFTREELYHLLWSTPVLTVTRQYKITDIALRKICMRMAIPLPRAGHWQHCPSTPAILCMEKSLCCFECDARISGAVIGLLLHDTVAME